MHPLAEEVRHLRCLHFPEYSRSIPRAPDKALEQAYREWVREPAAVLGYRSTGGARAVEHLRTIAMELQWVRCARGIHVMGADLMKVHPMGRDGPISDIEDHIFPSATAMLDYLDW